MSVFSKFGLETPDLNKGWLALVPLLTAIKQIHANLSGNETSKNREEMAVNTAATDAAVINEANELEDKIVNLVIEAMEANPGMAVILHNRWFGKGAEGALRLTVKEENEYFRLKARQRKDANIVGNVTDDTAIEDFKEMTQIASNLFKTFLMLNGEPPEEIATKTSKSGEIKLDLPDLRSVNGKAGRKVKGWNIQWTVNGIVQSTDTLPRDVMRMIEPSVAVRHKYRNDLFDMLKLDIGKLKLNEVKTITYNGNEVTATLRDDDTEEVDDTDTDSED